MRKAKTPTPTLKLDDLHEAPFNPRNIGQDALDGLAYSLEEFGDISGITFNTNLKVLVSGHQRLRALKKTHGDKLKFDGETITTPSGEQFRIRYVDWDEPKTKAALLAANAESIQGQFNASAEALVVELQNLNPEHWDKLMLKDIIKSIDDTEAEAQAQAAKSAPGAGKALPPPMELAPFEHYDYVLVMFKDSRDWLNFISRFPLPKRHFALRGGKVKSVGDCRVLDGKTFIDKLK